MMKLIASFLLCGVVLASCMPMMSKEDKNKRVTCQTDCYQKNLACRQTCRNNVAACHAFSTASTIKKYQHYKNEVCVKEDFLTLQLNSFRDPLQCRKMTCDCRADYQVCLQACGGMVYKSLRRVCP